MIPRYSVFRGPGNRTVAISVEPVDGSWFVKQGERGKKLRSTMVPKEKYSSFQGIKSAYVGDGYQLLFTGEIDAFGETTDVSASMYYWEAKSIDIDMCQQLLRENVPDMKSLGVELEFTDDMSGTRVSIGQTKFGLTRAPSPGCISLDGNGAGSLSASSSADLLCLIALLSKSLAISMTDADGNSLSRGKVINRCASSASKGMSAFLESRGMTSLVTTLRKTSVNQVRF